MQGKNAKMLRLVTVSALLMAINIVMSSVSIPVPGGHLYLNDLIISAAAILLPPFWAFAVGGVGAFIGDLLFYPAPMFVSLVTHGLQAVIISLCARKLTGSVKAGSVIGAVLGVVINVVGYTLGRAYVYSTPAYAVLKLPFQILQSCVGAGAALLLCWGCGLMRIFERQYGKIRQHPG